LPRWVPRHLVRSPVLLSGVEFEVAVLHPAARPPLGAARYGGRGAQDQDGLRRSPITEDGRGVAFRDYALDHVLPKLRWGHLAEPDEPDWLNNVRRAV
jgi:hypothetical protein